MSSSFWKDLKKPILVPSPMDGVTDAAFRFLMDKYSHPSLLITEFTNVEGLQRGAVKLLQSFFYHETETPLVAQVYGYTPHSFYNATLIVAELGFDGIDVNMGCPDRSISRSGGGAGLIRTPDLAKDIIRSAKQAAEDYYNGKKIEDTDLPKTIIEWIKEHKSRFRMRSERIQLPVSVKTRIGYDAIITEDWINNLLETAPAAISLHGRTLKQMYTGQADWEEIGKAARLVKQTETKFLGNGDIHTFDEALKRIHDYDLDGVLIGRSCFGNPWIFTDHVPTPKEQIQVALDHCEAFSKLTPEGHFASLRKHLAWYTKGIYGSNHIRNELMQVNTFDEVQQIFDQFERSFSTSIPNGVYLTP